MLDNILQFILTITPSSTDPLTPIIISGVFALIGVVLGSGSSLLTAALTNRQQIKQAKLSHQLQAEREQEAHDRHRIDAKKDRLRQLYAKVLYGAVIFRKAIAELSFLIGDETKEERDKRISAYLTDATSDMERLKVELMLEEPDRLILKTFEEVQDAFIDYTQAINMKAKFHGTYSVQQIEGFKQKASDSIEELAKILSKNLAY